MLMVRLQRVGRKHEPVFRLVLTDSKNSPKSGKFLEILGNFDARRGDKSEFKADRIKHWVSNGAQVSDTVHNLLIDKKIIEGKKINKLPKKQAIVKEKVETDSPKTSSPKEDASAREAVEQKEEVEATEKVEETTTESEVSEEKSPVNESESEKTA
jgi:small subunit ribosomal protein S16